MKKVLSAHGLAFGSWALCLALTLALSVAVPAQASDSPPIVFIHGLDSSEQMWVDAGLISHLESLGRSSGGVFHFTLEREDQISDVAIESEQILSTSGDLWRVNFDSSSERESNWAAIYLQARAVHLVVARVRQLTGAKKVILVGHSMGGLAGSAYLVADLDGDGHKDYQDDVAKLVTLGTPFGGSGYAIWLSLAQGIPDLEATNALRDLSKDFLGHRNVFLYGGNESEVSSLFYADVNADNEPGVDDIRGLNEMMVGSDWPADVAYFNIIGDWNGNSDCMVAKVDQSLTFAQKKEISASHASWCSSCTEAESFDAIVEALDEPDSISNAWEVELGESLSGFVTRYDTAGTDFDLYRLEVSGAGTIAVTLEDPPVAPTTLRLLDATGALACADDCEDSAGLGDLFVSFPVVAPSVETLYVEVTGWAEPSDPGFPEPPLFPANSACDPDVTNCPNCSAPYALAIQGVVGPSTLSLSMDPTQLVPAGASSADARVMDPAGNPVVGASVTFTSANPGTFTGCDLGTSPCRASTDAAGSAQVSFSSPIAGTATILASADTGGSDSASVTFASGAVVAGATPSSQEINFPSRIDVTVNDPDGTPVGAGVAVTFSTSFPGIFSGNGAGIASPQTLLTDSAGQTWIRFTGTAAGRANVTIDVPAVVSGTVVPIDFTHPSSDISIAISVGFVSSTGSSSEYELEAQVLDNLGAPIPGENVEFTASSGTLSDTDCNTGPTGVCDVDLTVTSSGTVTVTAEARGVISATSFFAQVAPPVGVEIFPTRSFTMADQVWGLDFSPDGSTLVATDRDGFVKAWNTSDWSVKWSGVETADDKNVQTSISPDGTRVLVTHSDGVDIFNTSNGSLICEVAGPNNEKRLGGTFVNNTVHYATNDFTLFRYGSLCNSQTAVYTIPAGDNFEVRGRLAYSAGVDLLAGSTQSGNLLVFDGGSGSLVRNTPITAGNDDGGDVAFNSTGSELLAVGWRTAKIFNTSGWSFRSLNPQNLSDNRWGAAFLDNDTKVAIGAGQKIELLDAGSGVGYRVGSISGAAYEIAWNQATEELAVGTTANTIYIFEPLAPSDNFAPVIEIHQPTPGAVTNDPNLVTTGTLTDDSTIASFTINGQNVTLEPDGSFSHTLPLTAGVNPITYVATDSPGNTATVGLSVTLNVDQTPPVISSVAIDPALGVAGTLFEISSTVVDGDTGVSQVDATVRDDGGAVVANLPMVAGPGDVYTATFDSAGAAVGFYTVDITAVDASPQANSAVVASAGGFSVEACYVLALGHTGSGGDPSVIPSNSPGCAPGAYFAGELLALQALPDVGWEVAGWSGTQDDASTSAINSAIMPAAAHVVSVTYVETCPGCRTDRIGAYRPSTRSFLMDVNGSGTWDPPADTAERFGILGDIPLIGDWNGDGDDDVGAYRPADNLFLLDFDESGTWSLATDRAFLFGIAGDVPLIGDWNGDGDDDIGVYRPADRLFLLDLDESGTWTPATDQAYLLGVVGDVPLIGDWNGDGDDDIGIYRPSNRVFILDSNESGTWNPGVDLGFLMGLQGDVPLSGDWNGDGDDNIGVYRPSNRVFLLDFDEGGTWTPATDLGSSFGLSGDTPLTGAW